MKPQPSEGEIRRVCEKIESMGFRAHAVPGAQRTAIGVTGNPGPIGGPGGENVIGGPELVLMAGPCSVEGRETTFAAAGHGAGGGRLGQPVAGADRVSGESAGSGGDGRCGPDDGAARRCGVRHSGRAGACRRSSQTHAGRLRQVIRMAGGVAKSCRVTSGAHFSTTVKTTDGAFCAGLFPQGICGAKRTFRDQRPEVSIVKW